MPAVSSLPNAVAPMPYADPRSSLQALENAHADNQARLRDKARDVVNVTFLGTLMKAMRKTQQDDHLLSGGKGEELFRQQLDTVLIDRMSPAISTPVADALVRQVGPDAAATER